MVKNLTRVTSRGFVVALTFSGEDRCGGDNHQGPGPPLRPHLGRAPASPAEQPAHPHRALSLLLGDQLVISRGKSLPDSRRLETCSPDPEISDEIAIV